MPDNSSSRRNFLKILGLSAGASLAGKSALAAFVNKEEIRRLNPVQQEFMVRYGKWMDEFVEVVRIQKAEPENQENQKKMVALTERAEKFKPELDEFMKDETFALVYIASVQRVTNEIT